MKNSTEKLILNVVLLPIKAVVWCIFMAAELFLKEDEDDLIVRDKSTNQSISQVPRRSPTLYGYRDRSRREPER